MSSKSRSYALLSTGFPKFLLLRLLAGFTQSGVRRANEAKVAAGDNKPIKDKSTFIGKDGERHSFVIPPDKWKAMTPIERTAALAKIRADKGLPLKAVWQRNPPDAARRVNSSNTSPSESSETMTSYVEVANPNSGSSVVSGVTQQSPAEPPASSSPSLRQVLTSTQSPASSSSTSPGVDSIVNIGGRFYRQCSAASIDYNLSNHASSPVLSSLIDGGANGGMAGSDVRVISESSFNHANVTGIGESVIQNLSLATVAGLVTTHRGPAIVLLHQYANYGKGHTIHLSSQLRAFGTLVRDTPRGNGGLQRLITRDGYHIPLCYRSGLPYMDMCPPNDNEMDILPRILLTGDHIWNPKCLDDELSIADLLLDAPPDTGDQGPRVNDLGQYTGNLDEDIDLIIHECRAEHHIRVASDDAFSVLK
jgi:hypothetical protein